MERVLVRNGCFRWSKGGSIVLENITFSVRDATLFAIVGSVGAGKSSVISAILGEMYRTQGEVHVRGSTAYVPQNGVCPPRSPIRSPIDLLFSAWIMNSTLKENILFGRPFDPAFYNGKCLLVPNRHAMNELVMPIMSIRGNRGLRIKIRFGSPTWRGSR